MIEIAVVDDEQRDREIILSYFEQIKFKLHEEVKVDLYDSGEKFLDAMNACYDLICLDIDLHGIDGIETARKIREQDSEVIILFVTNMAQLAIKGYEVHALFIRNENSECIFNY
jgi:DNA-binding response OmpR family regulator